jgi:hypothetical protein
LYDITDMMSYLYTSIITASILASIQQDINGLGVPMKNRSGKKQTLKIVKTDQRGIPWLIDGPSTKTILLLSGDNEEPIQEEGKHVSSNAGFDGEGFASYLAPYVATLVASLVVTAAFVKFVLLDY